LMLYQDFGRSLSLKRKRVWSDMVISFCEWMNRNFQFSTSRIASLKSEMAN
jgi:hypothetical protein